MLAKKIFKYLRVNGTITLNDTKDKRRLVYANMIWLTTFLGFLLYQFCVIIFAPQFINSFIINTLFCNLLFIAYPFIIKNGATSFGKHWLILITYFMVGLVDHQNNKAGFSFIYFFAFLPAAMNIFSLRTEISKVVAYTLLPLGYMIFTRTVNYNYPYQNIIYNSSQINTLTVINLVIGCALFIVFAGYQIINNNAKQQKLLVNSISLQATLDNSDTAIWSIDKFYNLTAVNTTYIKSMQKYFGNYDVKKGMNIKEQQFWTLFPENIRDQYEKVLQGQKVLEEITINNSVFEIKAVPVFSLNGEIEGATFGSQDITTEKNFKETLISAKKMAEEASNAKARFINNMSHEIRTPLNGIIGITRILEDEKFLPEQLPHLKTLQDLSDHTLQIINNILDFAKIEAGKASLDSKRFNLKRFIQRMYSLFNGTAQLKRIPLIFEDEGNIDVYVKGDEVRLSQVLINLFSNAFKFTNKGQIKLTTSILAESTAATYKIKFCITDTGIGIKSQNLNKIFESFTQADTQTTRNFGGTGLGLTIARKIVELMGGTLHVESDYGHGTSFSFEIELEKSSPDYKEKLQIPLQAGHTHTGLNILLAEDNSINQLVAKKILEKWKNTVSIVANGKEALEKAMKYNYDIVLMDLDMPVMDGYEATELIKQQKPNMPVIALTAASFDDMHNFLTNKGFTDVVQKPFIPNDLYSKISLSIKNIKQVVV